MCGLSRSFREGTFVRRFRTFAPFHIRHAHPYRRWLSRRGSRRCHKTSAPILQVLQVLQALQAT